MVDLKFNAQAPKAAELSELYIDAAYLTKEKVATIAAVLKLPGEYEDKKYVARIVEVSDILHAEAAALTYGLKWACQFKLKDLRCYTDSSALHDLFAVRCKKKFRYLVNRIYRQTHHYHHVSLYWIPREQNRLADQLAYQGTLYDAYTGPGSTTPGS